VLRVALGPVLVVVLLFAGCSDEQAVTPEVESQASPEPPSGVPAPEGIDGVTAVDVASRDHVRGTVEYPTYPPLGGDHFPTWHDCGFYDLQILDEAAVHSLEHGAVWVAYREDAPAEELDFLRGLADESTHVLVSAYPGLRSFYVVTAWGRQLDLDSIDDPRLGAFLGEYLGGGVAPEPGSSCGGGLSPEG
jgi:hypothetical protein